MKIKLTIEALVSGYALDTDKILVTVTGRLLECKNAEFV